MWGILLVVYLLYSMFAITKKLFPLVKKNKLIAALFCLLFFCSTISGYRTFFTSTYLYCTYFVFLVSYLCLHLMAINLAESKDNSWKKKLGGNMVLLLATCMIIATIISLHTPFPKKSLEKGEFALTNDTFGVMDLPDSDFLIERFYVSDEFREMILNDLSQIGGPNASFIDNLNKGRNSGKPVVFALNVEGISQDNQDLDEIVLINFYPNEKVYATFFFEMEGKKERKMWSSEVELSDSTMEYLRRIIEGE